MPTLTWIGKDKVVNHHHDVPYSVLEKKQTFIAPAGSPENSSNNRIIHGDNLAVLKSLLPEFEGRVNCIYIDPPYNTGNEGWVYNDNVNDPRIKKWLGDVVGKEGEDLTRHDKWLCMMYPRLKLLHRLLAEDGVIFISIDDNEQANLKLVCDEVFGAKNFVASIPVVTNLKGRNDKKYVASCHEYVLMYAYPSFQSSGIPLTEEKIKEFKYVDEVGRNYGLRDLRKRGGADTRGLRPNMFFPIFWNKKTQQASLSRSSIDDVEIFPIKSNGDEGCWRWGRDRIEAHLNWLHAKENKKSKTWGMEYRVYLDISVKVDELVNIENQDEDEDEDEALERTSKPKSFWFGSEFSSDGGKKMFRTIMDQQTNFDYPKSIELIKRCIHLGTNKNSIILDSFAGSGTTAHAVLKLNAQDGGNRQFILCEMMDYADTITAERVRRVMTGYGEGNKQVAGLGGAFDYYTLGEPLFNGDYLNESVGTAKIRQYVAYSENIPLAQRCENSPVSPYLLGLNTDTSWIFYYEPERETVLDAEFLGTLKYRANGFTVPAHSIIYADTCVLTKAQLERFGLRFKKIPRDITRL